MLDKAIVLTTLFTIVDDTMKGSAVIQHALKRPGPAPHLSDSELIAIALSQELIGEPREDHFFRLHQASLLPFFPGLNERSRYNRRKRDLWAVILAVPGSLQMVLEGPSLPGAGPPLPSLNSPGPPGTLPTDPAFSDCYGCRLFVHG